MFGTEETKVGFHLEAREGLLTYVKEAPRFSDILHDSIQRGKQIVSSYVIPYRRDRASRKVERTFTEREGLEDLDRFFDSVVSQGQVLIGKKRKDVDEKLTEMLKTVSAFRENLVFIGENELQEAMDYMAQALKATVQKGTEVYVCVSRFRSERYMVLRMMEAFDRLIAQDNVLGGKVKISADRSEIARNVLEKPDSIVVVPDDFSLSGVGLIADWGTMMESLIKAGLTPGEATGKIKALLVACNTSLKIDLHEQNANVFSYFGVKEYRDEKGIRYIHPGISITGSHCSPDYGFESVIQDDIIGTFGKAGVEIVPPKLYYVEREYELEGIGTKMKSSELQQRWEKIYGKYGLHEGL